MAVSGDRLVFPDDEPADHRGAEFTDSRHAEDIIWIRSLGIRAGLRLWPYEPGVRSGSDDCDGVRDECDHHGDRVRFGACRSGPDSTEGQFGDDFLGSLCDQRFSAVFCDQCGGAGFECTGCWNGDGDAVFVDVWCRQEPEWVKDDFR